MRDIQKEIAADIQNNKVILYVKGNRQMPMCGFSKHVMDIFSSFGVPFETRDVLSDPEIRDGIKQFTNWPTIPQVFIGGEFVGGCDIVSDLHSRGELKTMVEKTQGK